jgi:hypothetical protein
MHGVRPIVCAWPVGRGDVQRFVSVAAIAPAAQRGGVVATRQDWAYGLTRRVKGVRMAGFKERLRDLRARRRARRIDQLQRLASDPRTEVTQAQREEQSKLAERFPSSGVGG